MKQQKKNHPSYTMFFLFFSYSADLSTCDALCPWFKRNKLYEMASYLSILSSPIHLLVNSLSNIQYVFFQGFNSACHCFYNLLLHPISVPLSEHLDADNSKSKSKLPLSKMWYFKWFCCLRTEQNCLWDVKYFFQYLNHQGIYRTRSLKSARDCDRRMGLHA